eukprot:1195854-Prorocentrum_minimum.AAC.6
MSGNLSDYETSSKNNSGSQGKPWDVENPLFASELSDSLEVSIVPMTEGGAVADRHEVGSISTEDPSFIPSPSNTNTSPRAWAAGGVVPDGNQWSRRPSSGDDLSTSSEVTLVRPFNAEQHSKESSKENSGEVMPLSPIHEDNLERSMESSRSSIFGLSNIQGMNTLMRRYVDVAHRVAEGPLVVISHNYGSKTHWPIFTVVTFLINCLMFVMTLYKNNCPEDSENCEFEGRLGRFAFEDTKVNPLYGPRREILLVMVSASSLSLQIVRSAHEHTLLLKYA